MSFSGADRPTRLDSLIERAARLKPLNLAVVFPNDEGTLQALLSCQEIGLAQLTLYGDRQRIASFAQFNGAFSDSVVDTGVDPLVAAAAAIAATRDGAHDALMKGSLKTHELLSAVLKRDSGLRSGRRLTHTFLFDVLRMRKLLALTDAAVNVAPTAATKMECLANALSVMRALGVDRPKVALLAAVEVVREQLRSTLDAQEIAAKANVDERFAGAVIEGPMALDVALSDASASRKGIASEVAGDPDVLLAPNLDAGSLLYKSLVHLGQAQCAGVVLGSSVPIALTGRVDSVFSRVASVALASVVRNAA